jgi:hypothetical protein
VLVDDGGVRQVGQELSGDDDRRAGGDLALAVELVAVATE